MKKYLAIVLTLMMVFALAMPMMAKNVGDKVTAEGFGFHCNDIEGSNGRTYVPAFQQIAKNGKLENINTNKTKVELARTDDPTVWDVVNGAGDWACVECGRTDWITYSNKSGVPDGKNIQLQHPYSSREWITVTIMYNIDIPECDIECKVADCDFDIDCDCDDCDDCECVDCEAKDHTCDEGCATVCDHFDNDRVLYRAFRYLIRTAVVGVPGGDVLGMEFDYDPDLTWRGGDLTDAKSPDLPEWIYSSETYDFFYESVGDCVCLCVCDGVACECIPFSDDCEHFIVCDVCDGHEDCNIGEGCELCEDCRPCICEPDCEHVLVCSVCYDDADKELEKGSHPGCHNVEGGQNTFFCLGCDYKETDWNNGNNPAPIGYCKCPVCLE